MSRADKVIEQSTIDEDDITRIIKSLNPDISHGCDKKSITIIKICAKCVIFDASFDARVCPEL